jgi:mannose-6-phosphate isomerase class I
VIRPAPTALNGGSNRRGPLIAAPYFAVDMFELRDQQAFRTDDAGRSSVQILVAIEGCGIVEADGMQSVTLAKGDAVVVPASVRGFRVRPQWNIEFLKAYVPGEKLGEPATRM